MSLLTRKDLKDYERAVLFVTSFSDLDVGLKDFHQFLECGVMATVPQIGDCDRRYVVYCAEDLREAFYKNGMFSREAMVSEWSPLLMAKKFFEQLKEDDALREQFLQELEELILGTNIPEGLEYWRKELIMIIEALGISVQEVIDDIRAHFTPEKMEMVPIEGTVPVRYQLSL